MQKTPFLGSTQLLTGWLPGGHTLASHRSLSTRLGDSSPPPLRPPRPLVGLGKAPWVQGASSGQEERPCCGKSHEEAEATGQAPVESPKASAASVASAPRTEEAKPAIPGHLDSSQQTGSVQEESKAKAHCVE